MATAAEGHRPESPASAVGTGYDLPPSADGRRGLLHGDVHGEGAVAATATAWGLGHGLGLGRVLVLAGFLAVAGCSASEPSDSGEKAARPAVKATVCSLLNADDVRQAFGSTEAFTGTQPDPVGGKRPWGCTWGSRSSYASVGEVSHEDYRAGIEAPGVLLIPQNIGTGDSFAVHPADDAEPMEFAFTTGDRFYRLEVIPARDGDYPRYRQGDIGTTLLRLLIPAIENTRN
ncbi:hypothetical protein ABT025_24615 [Streptomyces sp. NPDC002809]|uniref:hypothetical protein n=1 Tax=Streptomyces sp. NPDC002809 TaxID=3154433 RepID=UPI00331B6760